jgi:hypothetical protein
MPRSFEASGSPVSLPPPPPREGAALCLSETLMSPLLAIPPLLRFFRHTPSRHSRLPRQMSAPPHVPPRRIGALREFLRLGGWPTSMWMTSGRASNSWQPRPNRSQQALMTSRGLPPIERRHADAGGIGAPLHATMVHTRCKPIVTRMHQEGDRSFGNNMAGGVVGRRVLYVSRRIVTCGAQLAPASRAQAIVAGCRTGAAGHAPWPRWESRRARPRRQQRACGHASRSGVLNSRQNPLVLALHSIHSGWLLSSAVS